ncbi:hypothetical protein HAX54_034537 [Datura stramonium]|uniref:Uncharacterized protein n=1 Tax=Datura stramonium TaxID=4076 RepID=A0ABS8VFA6_DATST|nr:hypothetical protein [Datura stramonium]
MMKRAAAAATISHDIHSLAFPYFATWQKLHGLVMVEGDEWVRHRHVITPAFTTANLKGMASLMSESATHMLDRWAALINSGNPEIDVESEIISTAGEIIAKTSFGISYEDGEKKSYRNFAGGGSAQDVEYEGNGVDESSRVANSTPGNQTSDEFDGEVDPTRLAGLRKMGWVMNEVLRLYSPAPNVQRQAREYSSGQFSHSNGTNMWIDVVSMHHDKKLWGEDVYEFKPERFKDDIHGGCKHKISSCLLALEEGCALVEFDYDGVQDCLVLDLD